MPTPRSGNVERPRLPKGTITIQPPPDVVEGQGPGNIITMVVPMFGSMGIMVFMALSNNSNPRMLLLAGVMVVAMISMVGFTTYRQFSQHREKTNTQRREYLAYLSELRNDVRRGSADQRAFTNWNLPSPQALPMIVQQRERLWERDGSDPTTYMARFGTAPQPLILDLREPELSPLSTADPVCLSAVSRFVNTFETVEDLPTGISVSDYARVEIGGTPAAARALARTCITSLAALVGPELLRIAVVADDEAMPEWEWAKWLPHIRSHRQDAIGPMRMMGGEVGEITDLLPEGLFGRAPFRPRVDGVALPQLLLVLDGVELSPEEAEQLAREGVCVLALLQEWGELDSYSTFRFVLEPRTDGSMQLTTATLTSQPITLTATLTSIPLALATARRMAAFGSAEDAVVETASKRGVADPTRSAELVDLLGIGDVRDFEPERQIVHREGRSRLNVPFGVTPEGVPVHLDIKENAQQGMGPHGLLIGATGSGKSEVLRTIVLAMALTHSPEQLNFVLVDFKGGATFAGMSELPHVSATITNLESELSLVDRMEEALHGEMVRRQEMLRAAGNYANVRDYEKARREGRHQGAPMPALFIILDEFSELLTAKPGFIDTFVAIGRLGRSLEVHLLLATQRLEEAKLKGLESHLSYRIGLRTFSAQDSRNVLGTADAFSLPAVPGVGYLKTAGEGMQQFRASYVAGPPKGRRAAETSGPARQSAPRVLPFTVAPVLSRQTAPEQPAEEQPLVKESDAQWQDQTTSDVAIAKLLPLEPRAHQVWLPPLETPETLDRLFGDLVVTPELGLHSPSWRARGRLTVPLGVADVPREQRRETLVMDLAGGAGNVAIIGGPQSGKSTAMRTLIMALSLVNTPREAQFYILDFGGGTFAGFARGAHVAAVATRDRPDIVARVIAEIMALLADRQAYFREHGIDSIASYRRGREEGRYDDGFGDVYLVVDGWNNMKSDFMDMDRTIETIAGRGLAFGVHLLLASNRKMDLRQSLQTAIGTDLELRLGEPRESSIAAKKAELVPEGKPGHGLSESLHQMLLALPRIDAERDPESLGDGVARAWQAIGEAWQGQPGPKLRLLPERIDLEAVQAQAQGSRLALIGINEARLAPTGLDLKETPHLYLFGDTRKGKSTVLRTLAREVRRLHPPHEAQFFLVDFRRSMLEEIHDHYLAGYYTTHDVATAAMKEIAGLLHARKPGPDVTPQQLRERSWWSGPEFYIVVDDYDLVHTTRGNPLDPIVELLPQSQDLGLHVFVARRSGGAARSLYDPLLRGLIDLGAPGLLLAGDPEEGVIVAKAKFQPGPAGRGQLITRQAGRQLVQVAYSAPPEL